MVCTSERNRGPERGTDTDWPAAVCPCLQLPSTLLGRPMSELYGNSAEELHSSSHLDGITLGRGASF